MNHQPRSVEPEVDLASDREDTVLDAVEDHPSSETLASFMKGRLPREEARDVVRHLLSGCAPCRRETGAWWPKELVRQPESKKVVPLVRRAEARDAQRSEEAQRREYQPMFNRVAATLAARERAFSEERELAPRLVEGLVAMAPEERLTAAEGNAELHTWAVVEGLLDRSRAAGSEQPVDSVALADLATIVASRLPEDRYSTAAVHDLRARAWGQLGNAQRTQTLMWDAQASLDLARQHLERGSGDPVERCRMLVLQAALYGDLKRFDEAFALLDRVITLAERSGEDHLRGSALIRKARLAQRRDDPETAVALLREGVALIDPDVDPRQVLVAAHNLLVLLVDMGSYREAFEGLDRTRSLHRQLGGRLDFVRFRWLEAKIYAGLGWLDRAVDLYQEIRTRFIEESLPFDTALVSLELAAVYSQQDRSAEVRGLAEEMLPIFQSQKAHQEVMAALLCFRDAARQEAASLPLIHEVADYLRRNRTNPGLPFYCGLT